MTEDAVAQRAATLLDPRIQAVRELARTRERLVEAQRADAVAFQEAGKAGWTDTELRRLGFLPPARRVQGRPAQGGEGSVRRSGRRVEPVDAGEVPEHVRAAAGDPGAGVQLSAVG